MNNHSQTLFALQDGDGNLIGIDRSSGGYPWVPDTLSGVWLSAQSGELIRYNKVDHNRFRLVRVTVTVSAVEDL